MSCSSVLVHRLLLSSSRLIHGFSGRVFEVFRVCLSEFSRCFRWLRMLWPDLQPWQELAKTTLALAKTCSHDFHGYLGSLTFHQTAHNACLRALECRIEHAGQCQVRCLRWIEACINIYTCTRRLYPLHSRYTNDQFMHSFQIKPIVMVLLADAWVLWLVVRVLLFSHKDVLGGC